MPFFLYHRVPAQMIGSELIPLNELRLTEPVLYEKYRAKYVGREETMEQRIPFLNCLWNDTVFLSPVHPKDVMDMRKKFGFPIALGRQYFCIDASVLSETTTVVFSNRSKGNRSWEQNFDRFDPALLDTLTSLHPDTVDYYKHHQSLGTSDLLMYSKIPHILYKGRLNIASAPIIVV